MVRATSLRANLSSSLLLPVVTFLLAIVIFVFDSLVLVPSATATLYVVVVLLSSRFLNRAGVLMVALGCAALALLSYLPSGHDEAVFWPLLPISLAAIGATAFLALEDRAINGALREYAQLLDLTHDTIFVRDINNVLTYWSRGAEKTYGWTAEEVVGKVSPHELLHTVFPAPFEDIEAELLRTGRWEGELSHTRANGSVISVASRWSLQRDRQQRPVAILETNNDITERKRAIEALRQSEEQWREIFEHNPVMYFMVDSAGKVVSVNTFGANQLGYSPAELLGKSVLAVFSREDRDVIARNLDACLETPGQSHAWETRKIRKDGSVLWVREIAKAVRRPGNELIVLIACEDITERRRNQDLLRRNEAYLAEAQRLSLTGSFGWNTATGEIIWSEETFRILEFDKDVLPTFEAATERIHPEDKPRVLGVLDKALSEGTGLDYECRLLMPGGAIKYVRTVAAVTQDTAGATEYVGAMMDVTAARQAQSRIRQIIDTVPALIWTAGPDGKTTFLNKRYLDFDGLTLQEVLDSGWGGQIHPDDFPLAHSKWLTALAEGAPFEAEVRIRRFDGQYRWSLSRALPLLDHAGSVLGWYGSETDIHDRKLAEEALLKAQTDLAHVTRVTTLGELTASIAHEVNQPLAAVVTNGEVSLSLLEREDPDLAEVRDALRAMVGDGRRASEVIQRLRTLTTKAELQKAPLNINEVIREVLPLVRQEVLANGASLKLQLTPALPPVLGDRIQLQQVLINLLVNAMDAMATVEGRPRELIIRSQWYRGDQVLVAVQDSGVGIDPQGARELFDAFFTTKPTGMGMGLSICRSIVESHGGSIWASCNSGPGATLQFTLPADTGKRS
ncbi:MAG TPA: PAS domain S-box protein [Devosiaceae bacterium]|nr:PAS domain S-box protein [Devosiaceae bacterium]